MEVSAEHPVVTLPPFGTTTSQLPAPAGRYTSELTPRAPAPPIRRSPWKWKWKYSPLVPHADFTWGWKGKGSDHIAYDHSVFRIGYLLSFIYLQTVCLLR